MTCSVINFVRYLYSLLENSILRLLGYRMSSLGQGFQNQLGQGFQGQGQGQLGQGLRKCCYSAVSAGAGQAVAVFFRRPDGSIVEAFWRNKQSDWSSFREVLPKSATPPRNLAIAATLWANCHYRIYYFDENMNVCEVSFESKTEPVSKQLTGNPRASVSSGISAVCFHANGPNIRVYYVDADNKLQANDTWGKETAVEAPDMHPDTALQFVTLTAWDNDATEIRGYYQDTSFSIRELTYQKGAWDQGKPIQSAKSLIPFAAAVSGAASTSPKVYLYTVNERNQIVELGKEGIDMQAKWGNNVSIVSATAAKSLAAIGNSWVEDSADVHIYSSDDVGDNFVHNWKSNGTLVEQAEIVMFEQPQVRVIPFKTGSMVTAHITPAAK
ncbi:hypothetical protein TWF696_007913 [Orbilia brochopaga]|uniref:Fucose-specific lectin n=1 Tax=Orbilia brochopaga TaxID=3140254 RepID=A0AAV9USQ9_9PEZI